MASHVRLLPPHSATPLELALAQVNDPWAALADDFNAIPYYDANIPTALLPFIVWEYGLGELSPYLPNLYDLISQGVAWQRVRGTPQAISMALGWLNYSAALDEEPYRRLRWNRFMLAMGQLPSADIPDLQNIDGVVGLSVPVRSNFGRGYRTYDVRACEASFQRYGEAIYSDHSGIRLLNGSAQWSFGRETLISYELTQAELTALGVWSEPAEPLPAWSTMNSPWTSATYPWWSGYAQTRRNAIVAGLTAQPTYIGFYNAAGNAIGFSRACVHGVAMDVAGALRFGASSYSVSANPTAAMAYTWSPFNSADGATVASVKIAFSPTLAAGIKPGALWLGPNDITSAVYAATSSVSLKMAATIREHIVFMLDLDTH